VHLLVNPAALVLPGSFVYKSSPQVRSSTHSGLRYIISTAIELHSLTTFGSSPGDVQSRCRLHRLLPSYTASWKASKSLLICRGNGSRRRADNSEYDHRVVGFMAVPCNLRSSHLLAYRRATGEEETSLRLTIKAYRCEHMRSNSKVCVFLK